MIALAVAAVLVTIAVFLASVVLWGDKHGWPTEDFPRPDGGEESGPGPIPPPGPLNPRPWTAGGDRNRTDEEFDPDEAH